MHVDEERGNLGASVGKPNKTLQMVTKLKVRHHLTDQHSLGRLFFPLPYAHEFSNP